MKRLLFLGVVILTLAIAAGSIFASAVPRRDERNIFSDVSGHWAEASIYALSESGAFSGIEGDKFMPDADVDRKQFFYWLNKALNIEIMYFDVPEVSEFFNDVKNDEWYAGALCNLATLGIIDYRDSFKPDSALTREEMVHFIMNAYRYKLNTTIKRSDYFLESFPDKDKVETIYRDEMGEAVRIGFIVGRDKTTLSSGKNATRAEAATVIGRLTAFLEENESLIKVNAKIERSGESLVMRLAITNKTGYDVVINHPSGQKYDFVLYDAGKNEIYRWSDGMVFTMAQIKTVIKAGATVEFKEKVNYIAHRGIPDRAAYLKAYIMGSSEDFTINTAGYMAALREDDAVKVEPGVEIDGKLFKLKLAVTNNSGSNIEISFNTPLKADFALLDSNRKEIWRWSDGLYFTQALSRIIVAPGKTEEFSVELDIEADKEILDKAVYLKAYVKGTSNAFEINPDGYEIKIK